MQVYDSIDLAFEEGVKWFEQELPLGPTNNETRAAIGVGAVQATPYSLNGTDVNVLVYDVGLVNNSHSDLVNRVIIGETGYIDIHSTHVSGTIGGNGTLSNGTYRGMAPEVNIISYHYSCDYNDPCICLYNDYESTTDVYNDFYEGITTYGADIGTASLGFQPARYGSMYCDYEGDYSSYAQNIDEIIHYWGIPITWAAANERNPDWRNCGEYHTISPTATAKNAIVVGAVNSNDNSMTGFSSWGPTDDGRIKPDIVAPGCENDPCYMGDANDPNKSIWSTVGSSYGGMCGTSMATPAVAGSIALMLEHWRNTHSGQYDPLPSTFKAILLNTAFDLGNPGPDYSFGYGRIDVKAAIDLISQDVADDNMIQEISMFVPKQFTIEVPPNMPQLRVTLAWDDEPGDPAAETALVYDSNLVVRDPNGNIYYPWILDPANPEEPAVTGIDHLNNVEQVSIDGPASGTWTVDVNIDVFRDWTSSVVWGFPKFFDISKEDGISDGNKVLPGDKMTYSIHYGYPQEHNRGEINEVIIIDYLPDEVEPNDPFDPNFDPLSRTYTWNIGTLSAGDTNTVTLEVVVNELAEPLGVIINVCSIIANGFRPEFTNEITDVNAWDPPVIYVDANATGLNTGMSWKNAYLDLQDALDRAALGNGSQIWVAGGTYIPSAPDYEHLTFQIIDGVPVYGHFAGNESSIYQRNFKDPANESILDATTIEQKYHVVTASETSQNNIIDGFTIKGGANGVAISDAYLEISNCQISDNLVNAIYAEESGFEVNNCTIWNNGIADGHGIKANFNHAGDIPDTKIVNSIIYNNTHIALWLNNVNSNVLVSSNLIYKNGSNGIYLLSNWQDEPNITIQNNSILYNAGYGIIQDISEAPKVSNCIIWGNYMEYQPYGGSYIATYSCIEEDPNINEFYPGTGNDANDPCFVDVDANNFHLRPDSHCKDAGDPNFNDYNATDIDGEPRIINGRVDMGADEVYWPKADYDQNEIVNFFDYALWAPYWLTDEPNGRLDGDSDVDIYDLALFCDDWLWIAPWSELYGSFTREFGFDMGMDAESETEQQILSEEIPADEEEEVIEEPMSDEQLQALIDWSQELWETNPEIREMVGQDAFDRVIESLKEQLDE